MKAEAFRERFLRAFVLGEGMDFFYHEEVEFEEQSPMFMRLHLGTVDYVILEHWHRSLELDYIVDCAMELTVNGERRKIMDGELALINSGDIHSMTPLVREEVEEGRLRAATIMISYDVLKGICPEIDQVSFDLERNQEKREDLKAVYREMICLKQSPEEPYGNVLMTALLYRLCYLLLTYFKTDKSGETVKSQKYIERVRRVLNYMDIHYQEPLTLQGVADEFYVSMEYLARVLKRYTGSTFKEYLNKIRLMKAFEELIQTDYTVLEVALHHGFSDVRSFIGIFKKHYGLTPFQYRKRYSREDVSDERIEDVPHVRRLK